MYMELQSIIKKWVLFGYNYPRDFIQKCWADENKMFIEHLISVFEYKCKYDMNNFFCSLDSGNQEKLVNWIFENYKG